MYERLRHRLRNYLKTKFGSRNEENRDRWVEAQLRSLPRGWRLLDACAGEQPYRSFCQHLTYVSQDFCKRGKPPGTQVQHAGSGARQTESFCGYSVPENPRPPRSARGFAPLTLKSGNPLTLRVLAWDPR